MTELVAGSRLGCNCREADVWTLCEILWKTLNRWLKRPGFDGMWRKLRLSASRKDPDLQTFFLLESISTFVDNSTGLVGPWCPSTKLSRLHWPVLTAHSAAQSASWSFYLGVPSCASTPSAPGALEIQTPILYLENSSRTDFFLQAANYLLVDFMIPRRSSPIFLPCDSLTSVPILMYCLSLLFSGFIIPRSFSRFLGKTT